jgi:hypothetical protein
MKIILIIPAIFIFGCTSSPKYDNPNPPIDREYLITDTSIGYARLGQEIKDFKNAYKDFTITEEPVANYGVDGTINGFMVSKDNKDLIFVWTMEESTKIECIYALSEKFKTTSGLHPNMTAGQLKKAYPKMKLKLDDENTSIEFFYPEKSKALFMFVSADSAHVGKYNDIEDASDPIDTAKILTWITIKEHD